jgi:hypothetical protein
MRLIRKYTGNLLLMAAAITVSTSSFAADTGEQLALCKGALKELYGEGTRVRMYGTKSYKGILTLKLKVTPEDGNPVTLQCVGDAETEQRVVLKNKEGNEIAS